MSIKLKNFINKNNNIDIVEQKGIFTVIEHMRDLSVVPQTAQESYFMSEMNCVKRQLVVNLQDNAVRLKPGAMQMVIGNIESETGVKGVGDLLGKAVKAKATGDNAIKPLYKGSGYLICEPTYKFILLEDISYWNGAMVCIDGSFLACDDEIQDKVVARQNVSSAVAGGAGLFNLSLEGEGYVAIKSPCPREELYEIEMNNDCVKIDGNYAIAWSKTLQFTVERSSKSLIGSAANGEGLVNVYRGTGRILVRPV